jgi:hypothetical protein
MEFIRFFPKGLNPFKIQTRFKLDFTSEFYYSKSIEILRLGQKGNLSTLNLSATLPNLRNFGDMEYGVLYF